MMSYMDAALMTSDIFIPTSRCGCSLIFGLRLQSIALRGPDEIR